MGAYPTPQRHKAQIVLVLTFSLFLLAVILLMIERQITATNDWSSFVRTMAGALTGSFVGALVTYLSLFLVEIENEVPEIYGTLNVARILKMRYFAKDFVLRVTLLPDLKHLVFEITAKYIPVKIPCECRILRVSDIDGWGGTVRAQSWTLGESTLDLNSLTEERQQNLSSRDSGFLTYQYLYEFQHPSRVEKGLSDIHVFKFFCESARIEALLPPGYRLHIERGVQIVPVLPNPHVLKGGLQRSVCCIEGAWAYGDQFLWKIVPPIANNGLPTDSDH
jgi:hypothetical protein